MFLEKDNPTAVMIKEIAFLILGALCFGYMVGGSDFAEIGIFLPFLNFPIFISEIVLIAFWLFVTYGFCKGYFQFNKYDYAFLVFMSFIVVRVLYDYITGGPLALRHGALFYYMFYAFFSYHLFNRKYFSQPFIYFLLLVFLGLFVTPYLGHYALYPSVLLFVVLIWQLKKGRLKKFILFFFVLFIVLKGDVIRGSRSHLVGLLITMISLTSCFVFFLDRFSKRFKILVLIAFLTVLGLGVDKYFDKSALRSMVFSKTAILAFHKYDAFIKEHKDDFVFRNIEPKLYNKNKSFFSINAVDEKVSVDKSRDLGIAYNNIFFRIFIWRDMIEELRQEKALFGVGFAKPQRSKSIEMLRWAPEEWKRDGWIAPHNSYLHMIYRQGIIGLVVIIFLLWLIFHLTRFFIVVRSITGLLLMTVLLYWALISNFLVFLEVPYYAILFWSLLGFTLAYQQTLLGKRDENTSCP